MKVKKLPYPKIDTEKEKAYIQNYRNWFETTREKEKKDIEDRLFRMLERTALRNGSGMEVSKSVECTIATRQISRSKSIEEVFDFSSNKDGGADIRMSKEFNSYKRLQRQDTSLSLVKESFKGIDHDTATSLLVAFDWDVEAAIQNYKKNSNVDIKFIMPNRKSYTLATFTYESTGMDMVSYLLTKFPVKKGRTYSLKANEKDRRLGVLELSKTIYDMGIRGKCVFCVDLIHTSEMN